MEPGQYYSVTTRRFTLQCNHEDWLRRTQELYNEVLFFYYQLFLEQEEAAPGSMTGKNCQQALRSLEVLTIVGRDRQPVPFPLPWDRLPLYFRRAAINGAAGCARGHLERSRTGKGGRRAESFHMGVTYYKGMYRELSQHHVSLKLWTGSEWRWTACRLKGNEIPPDAVLLSPTVVLERKGSALLLPVKQPVTDGRKAKERVGDASPLCCVQFTGGDVLAVAVILDGEGKQRAVRFIRGGSEYEHRCRELTERIRSSQRAMGIGGGNEPGETGKAEESDRLEEPDRPEPDESGKLCGTGKPGGEPYNRRYWMKLKHLKDHYAHSVSRQIIRFSQENQAGIIVLPRYGERFRRCVMGRAGNWSALHLGGRTRELVFYKAWQAGMVVLEVNASGTSSVCSVCGEKVKKSGSSYECPGGHRGSRQINTARNLGIKCLESFGRTGVTRE